MRPTTSTGVRRPALLTLADIQRRGAELLGRQPFHQAKHEPPPALEQPHPASPAQPQFRDSGYPRLPTAALHGLAGAVVRTIAPHTEAHPAAILLQLLAALATSSAADPTAWS